MILATIYSYRGVSRRSAPSPAQVFIQHLDQFSGLHLGYRAKVLAPAPVKPKHLVRLRLACCSVCGLPWSRTPRRWLAYAGAWSSVGAPGNAIHEAME